MSSPPELDRDLRSDGETVVDGIRALRDQYRRRARFHRMWFRATGVLVIVLSALLPLLAGLDFGNKDITIGLIGFVIAVVVGLRSFYQWDQLWSLLRQSDFELTYLLDKWELDVAAARQQTSKDAAREVYELTVRLRDAAEEVRRAESTRYFGSLRFPGGE